MRFRYLALTLSGLFLCLSALQAANFELEVVEESGPGELSEAVSAALSPQKFQIKSDQASLFDFWFTQEPVLGGENAGVFGIGFGEVTPGSFLGVVRVHQGWMDYKNKPVQPGLYTLRYGLQPADGNHIGVTAYRDFALLLPVAEDTDPAVSYEYQDLVKKASLASGTPHPWVIGMFPLYDEVEQPEISENEEGQPVVALELGSLKLGLVLEGHGEIKGY